jgi:hypothetical protein
VNSRRAGDSPLSVDRAHNAGADSDHQYEGDAHHE